MPVQVDPSLPVHPLSVTDVYRMVDAGILSQDDGVELLDGVLVEVTPPGPSHAYAVRKLNMLAVPAAAAAGLEVSVQDPLTVPSPINLPLPDLAISPPTTADRLFGNAVLAVEVSVTSRRVNLGRKAGIYAEGGVPEYWVLDVERRELIVHSEPADGRYTSVRTLAEDETVIASGLELALPISALL